jgi:putative ABC transport system substrate-binding protein
VTRRQFIALIGGAAAASLAAPLPLCAQQAMPVIGFLSSRSPAESAGVVGAFRQGLRQAGFVEGQNLAIAFRWAEGRYETLPALAAELVGLRVAVLVSAGGTPAALAAKAATSTIPVVFWAVGDPVGSGLVASLGRPGGNVTGMSVFAPAVSAKRVELLKELLPSAGAIAFLVNPTNPFTKLEVEETQAAARTLGIRLHILTASTEEQVNAAYAGLDALNARGLIVSVDPFFDSRRERHVALSAQHRAVASYAWREYVAAGGLMSYGPSLPDSYRQAGVYAGRVIKGERPADLPVMQPTKFELAINLKTAKALGLAIPASIMLRADEVIE